MGRRILARRKLFEADKYLKIAEKIRDGVVNPKDIIKELGVSPHDIKTTRWLLDNGYMAFDQKLGVFKLTRPVQEIENELKKRRYLKKIAELETGEERTVHDAIEDNLPEQAAVREIDRTVKEEIAAKAKAWTEEDLKTGKVLRDWYWKYAVKHLGMSPEQAMNVELDKLLPEVFRKAMEYDKLIDDYRELVEKYNAIAGMLDPIVRLDRGIELLSRVIELVTVLSFLGIDVSQTPIIEYYTNLVEHLIMGKPLVKIVEKVK